MKLLNSDHAPLGLGCWPIGGAMYAADGSSLGYSNANDEESVKALHAALNNGITVFDTAAAYGAGHSERLLGKVLGNRSDVMVVTKIGFDIDEKARTLAGEDSRPESVIPAIERCLERLGRESIDLLLLHLNALPVDRAVAIFDEMQRAVDQGKIRSYGWSTDITNNAEAVAERSGFVAVEHAMHVLMDAPSMQKVVNDKDLVALIRSPLAMGLLSGKYGPDTKLPDDDVRSTNPGWAKYYIDGRPNPEYVKRFQAVRELLQSGGRTTIQGALAWLWAKSDRNIPIPGARTVDQVEGLAASLDFGPLPPKVMEEIEQLVGSDNISHGIEER
ncbi:MAG: aldo/keto reductase [Gammaproteobacteria bacterium]|nr:aldo/keto reductase [Gammaproteobacteria bacterium]